MRAYSIRSTERSKGRFPIPPEIQPEAPPPRVIPPSPEDRASRLVEIRLILADAAPAFRARIASGESEARP